MLRHLLLACLLCASAQAAEPAVVDATKFIDPALPDCGIQRAIDALPAAGGVVELPEGDFRLERYLYLRSGVTLRGRGEETILRVGLPETRVDLVKDAVKTDAIEVKGDLGTLRPGMVVIAWRFRSTDYLGYIRDYRVKAIEGQTVVLDRPTAYELLLRNRAQLSWGLTTALAADVGKGATTIRVEHPDLLKPGYAITFGGQGDVWGHHFNVVTAIDGDVCTLERPCTVSAKAGTLVNHAYCLITADGENGIGVEDIVLQGWETEEKPRWGGFTLAGLHTVRCSDITLKNVCVRDWNGDGISIQAGKNARVEGCRVERCRGRGFHPGTDFTDAEFVRLYSAQNAGDGFYYCWHNKNVNLRDSVLTNNDGHGVGGLGNPGDARCTVEGNTITGNGRCGIEVNGGGDASRNVIRNNVIRDNSRLGPGKWPGIGLIAASEDAGGYTVEGNTVESTLEKPTQFIGIEERNGDPLRKEEKRGDKVIIRTRLADNNVIRNNRVSGHPTADIKVVGRRTTCEGNEAEKVITELTPPLPDAPATTEGEK